MARPSRPLSRLLERLFGALLFHRRPLDPGFVEQLRREAAQLGAGGPKVTDDAAAIWELKRAALRRLLREADPTDFLRWEPVRTTMVKRGRAPVAHELRYLRRRSDWARRWRPALRESTLGRPRPFHLAPWTSGSLIHQAYHLARFEEVTDIRLPALDLIVEFGGGYGSLCRLFHQLGFAGTYVIFDLPEVSVLQRFFLGHLGMPVAMASESAFRPAGGVITTSDPETLAALVPTRLPGRSAFIAAWSLGETPLELRARILAGLGDLDAYLIGYSEHFEGIDNRAFFRQWRATLPAHVWHDEPLPHLRKAEWYLFGARRRA